MKRNLIYYVCPFESSRTEWIQNLRVLNHYLHTFNGKKIITIAQGKNIAHITDVREVMCDMGIDGCDIHTIDNNPELGEVIPFMKMMRLVESTSPNEITFYAHAKGVRPRYSGGNLGFALKNIRIWRNAMYYFLLNDIDKIENILSEHPCVGCFKMLGGLPVPWFYAGTFFWFNHSKVFSDVNWQRIKLRFDGVECYLAEQINVEDSYTLIDNNIMYDMYGLKEDQWNQIFEGTGVTADILENYLQNEN